MTKLTQQIDNLLPQTQCGQCGYGGCLPYAVAIAEMDEMINRCPPGGTKTLNALANLLKKDAAPFLEEMAKNELPPSLAFIQPTECIGCTKCIQACPVDAILGAAKQLHFVLKQECTGCGLCVSACPVDCIDMHTLSMAPYQPQKARFRFLAKKQRLEAVKHQVSQIRESEAGNRQRQDYIASAVARAQARKSVIKKRILT
jgi:Na+-translocating ferredoxin:NAD+ oxidoreductase subunit B